MSYENAPATRLLATHCVACGRPLLDAKSVEAGMGPDCRERHGFNQPCDAASRALVNKLVHALALWRKFSGDPEVDQKKALTLEEVVVALKQIREQGFVHLADVLEERLATVVIEAVDRERLVLFAPYSDALRAQAGRLAMRWDRERKGWLFYRARKGEVFAALCSSFPASLGRGPKGPFALT